MRRHFPRGSAALLGLVLLLGGAGGAAAQANGSGGEELRALREASAAESSGDLAGAEMLLRGVLDANPSSLSALLSLERLVRMRGQVEEILPVVDRHLKEDPSSAIGHQMRVRAFSSMDLTEAVEKAGDTWIRATPKLETPYREVARIWEQRGEVERAVGVLERGRDRLGQDALALELGDLYAKRGDVERAVQEWGRAIGQDAGSLGLVRRRLGAQPDGGARVLPVLIEALVREPTTLPRRMAAVELAVAAGLAPQAEEVARGVAGRLKGGERAAFLIELARSADGAGLSRLAYWAYQEMLVAGGDANPADTSRMLAVRSRVAELALAVGDTARARETYAALEGAYAADSPERRRATALRIELTAREGHTEEALRELQSFRNLYPDAPEADVLAATVAESMLARGDQAGAERILMGVSGPRSSHVRGYLALARGDVAAARSALLAAAPGLGGSAATRTIELVTLLKRLSPEGGKLLGRAMSIAAASDTAGAIEALGGDDAARLAASERAALLDHAAGFAQQAGWAAEAARLRRRIVTEHPAAQETPGALLALSRWLGGEDDGATEARALLERLILEHPRSALVPQARRELDRLRTRATGS